MKQLPNNATNKPFEQANITTQNFYSRSNKKNGSKKYIGYGVEDKYPETIENIIFASTDATAGVSTLASHLYGVGFENEAVNNIVIGKDQFGKNIKVIDLLSKTAFSLACFGGFYWKIQRLNNSIGDISMIPFVNCRLAAKDDLLNIFSILYRYQNENCKYSEFDYFVYSDSKAVIESRIQGSLNKETLTYDQIPECYFGFFDPYKNYPIAPIHSAQLDADSGTQMALLKNNSLRNGLFEKTIVYFPEQTYDVDEYGNELLNSQNANAKKYNTDVVEAINSLVGAGGASVIPIGCQVGVDGVLKPFETTEIKSNINPDLTSGWQNDIKNSIALSLFNMPNILLDINSGANGLSAISMDSLKMAVELYDNNTHRIRMFLENCFSDVFKSHPNPQLSNNTNWKIKKISSRYATINTGTTAGN